MLVIKKKLSMQIILKCFPTHIYSHLFIKLTAIYQHQQYQQQTTTTVNIESETVHFFLFRISCCLCMNSSSHVMGKRNNKDEKSKYELIHAEEQCTTQNNNR